MKEFWHSIVCLSRDPLLQIQHLLSVWVLSPSHWKWDNTNSHLLDWRHKWTFVSYLSHCHYKYLLVLISKDQIEPSLAETRDLLPYKAWAHGIADSREISLPACISNRICPAHKGTVPKSQPNEAQRILMQLARIHQTCKADALKIFRFPSASASSIAVPSTTFPAARPHIRQYVDEGK